jgi:hypothetical protein
MEQDRREQERINLLAAIAGFAKVMNEFDERISVLTGRRTAYPSLASLIKIGEKDFAAEVVTAMKSLRSRAPEELDHKSAS